MPRIVEIPGVAELSFPDDLSEDEMLVQTRKFYEQSKQGAIGAASSATVREPARLVGGSMKAAARVADWLQPAAEMAIGMAPWQLAESEWPLPGDQAPDEKQAPIPPEETALYKAGESLQRGAEKMFPVNPLRADDFLTQVGSGIGSIPTSVVPYLGQIIYAGATGEEAAEKAGRFYDNKIAEAMAAGNGAEASRLQEEKKFQQKVQFGLGAGLGYATERFMGVVPGLKQITEGGGKLIPELAPGQVVENTKKLAGYFAKQGAKTTVGEFAQEGLEQAGGNLGEKLYNPEVEFLDGVAEASGVGGTVGATTSIPLALLGSKLRKNRLDRIKEFRDTRLAEGPLSVQQVNEINNRIVSGQPLTEGEPGAFLSLLSDDPATQSSVGGNNAELLPNATATLAGINSGGPPSGPIKLVPPGGNVVTVGANAVTPEEVSIIPDIALETDVADEEIATAVAPETVAASETSVSTTPITPAAATEVQPLTIEETQEFLATFDAIGEGSAYDILNEEEIARFEDLYSRIRQLQNAGFQFNDANGWVKVDTTAGIQPAFAATPQEPTPFRVAPDFRYTITEAPNYGFSPLLYEDADFELERLQTQAERGRLTAEGFAQSEIGMRMNSGQMSGVNIGLRSDPVGTIVALRAALVPAPAATPAATPTPAAAPKPTPAPSPAIANQTVGNGKYGALLVKDLFAQQPDYAMWLVRSTRSATPGSRQRQVGDYINSLPEYQNAVTEERAKAEAILTDENQTFLAGLKINARQNPDGSITLRGKTYDRKEELTNAGGRYSQTGNDKFYTISAAGLGQFIERSRADSGAAGGQRSSGPAYSRDVELRKLREDADNRPDRSGLEGGVDNYLGVETQELIRQGEEFGIPREVGDEQIEDAALMVQAFATDRPFFMLSSAPGTGKTFVLGAGIREMKDRFARKIIYVTLNRGLIKQIQQDLKAYNIGDVKFITYSEMKDLPVEESDVIIFDEAHAIKNLAGSGSEQAKKAQEWILKTKFPIFSTATPFENPTQTAYLLNTGIFNSFNGDYKQFAAAYGAAPIKGEGGQVVRTVWLPTKTNEQDQIAARNFFRKEGIFTARKTRLPAEQVDSRLVPIKGDEEWTNTYNAFAAEAEAQKSSLDGTEKMWIINYKKRLLEASKIKNAISEARRALSAERWPIIFVETKAERSIDIQEQLRLQEQFKRAKAIAERTGGDRPKRSDYKGLLSDGIINVLEATMERIGTTVISIPSAEDVIKNEIGANDVAIFTGSVPDNRAQKNLDLWRGDKPMVLVATMAKGGTGLSLHDKTGAHPTTQINVNLPWTASQVEQVSLRSARYGLRGKAQMMWLFADNIPFERELATRVGGRMRDMGALVQGEVGATATNIKNFNFEDESFSEANAAEAAKKDLTKVEPKVTPPVAPVTPTPAAPTATAPKKRYKAREWASKGDILDDIISLGGVMSKSQAKKDKRLEKIQSLYDDAPRLDPYFNKIFAGRKRGEGSRNQPDVLLQELAMENPGKYGDMTVAEFWAEVEKAARGRKGDVAAAKEEAKAAEEGAAEAEGLDAFLQAQDEAFVDAQTEGMQNAGSPDGPVQISVGSLAMGDRFFVQGELFEVTSVTPDGQYTIRDGEKFGVQQLTENDTLFVDKEPIRAAAAKFLPEEAAPAQLPRLGAMQRQGDLLSGQSEAFALVGEKGVDYEKKQREAQAAARAAAEAKAAQEKAQTQMDLGNAVAEVSDAIAQFVESITPKAGITEGPTPEQSARRVLEALTNLASKAILAGIRSASRWAAGLQMKLSPALQYAWDRAQGSTVEPTPEVIADVATLPERANSSDFGMIYSTPGKPVTTKRGAYEDTVAGRRSRTPEVQSAGIQLAVDAFNEAGVKFRQVGDTLFAPVEGVDQEEAGRKLIEVAKKKIEEAKKQGRSDTIAELIQSLRNHFGVSEAFSPDTRDELYLIGQSEASQFGINLASLRASVKDFVAMARNVRGFLTSAIYANFNGESVKGVMDKIMTEFRGQFTEAEIQKIVGEKPELQQMLNRFGVLALADTGGRVYRAVQARLTKKKPTTQKAKEQREIENEAIEQIIQNALDLGVTEPVQPPNRKLTADERLALMTRPGTQAKVQKATEDAVKQAEFNAGWAVMMASAAGNEELSTQYQEAKDAGEEPDPEAIEEGLDLPKYAHWRTIRDGFLNYSPTTLKLAQDVIRGRFKGTQFGPKKVAPPAPAKIDLARLVQSPNAEMSRVIGEQLAAIEGVMDLAGASPEAKARVMQMITANVGSQVQLARQRVLNNFLDVKVKAAPIGASERLQRLINAGIIEDPRYKGDKTVELLKRVARKYITTQEFKEIATTDQAQKLPALTAKFNAIVSSENLTDEWMQGAVWTYLTERLQEAEKEITGRFFDLTPKPEPTTAGERLRKLINAGIANDPRYQSEPTRKLLKRVAKTYLTADELSGIATRPRAEKLAFLTGKLNQITAAEKLTDEWMQGAVWTYLTERMMEAENAVVSQIVGAKDVSFDPALPKTDAQLAADRAKAVERLAGGIRAGLLDQRIAESVAKNPALQRLVPKMSDLVKRVLNTPQAGQAKLAQAFSEALLAELAIDQALADKTGIALAKAFEAKFERARIQALDKAVKNLTPKQREDAGPGTPLWQKIEQFVNAGGMNSAALLQNIAKKSGWKIPTDEEVSRFRDLARLEQELSTATEEEINAGITDDIKAAMNEGKRMDVMRELQMRWARMTMPIRGNKQNLARAAKEYGSANTLLKFGFITKQLIDVATQMFIYTPSRATATAIQRFTTSRDPNRTLRLWKDVSTTLEDAYKARFDALDMAYKSAIQAAKGRAEKDTIMGLQTGMRALDRLKAQADEYAKKGNHAQATVLRIIGIAQLSYRFASSLDAFQGVLAEQQEIGAWTESQLRLQGMAPAEARKAAKIIMGDALAEYALAQALIGDNPNIAPKDRSAAAWNVVRARQYQRIATAGLDAGDIKGITQNLRSTIGWNVEEEGGPGGVIGQAMKSTGKILSRIGIPDLLGMFSNAVAIGVNRGFTFAGGGFVPGAFEGSAWYKTETDKVQRKIEAATGLGLSGLFVGLVLSGALRVFTHWPDDKEEADLWEREGHKPNTMELDLPGGKILRVSLSTGPFQFVRPALAAVGELQYQQARRDRLNQKAGAAAKKKGLKFEPRELTAMDIVSALGYGAWSAIAQGRTTSGLIGAGTYRGTADVGKIAAATVSPLIPFGPLMREATAMSGAQFNPKDQTFINLLAPTPWSGKVDRNFLGDPVGTPRATERIMSILTGGTAIVGGEDPDRAYQVLAKTGWTPATPQSNKFFQFGRVQRQATPEELTRMQEVRAVELKTRISQLDPATATKRQLDRIEDIANAKSKKAVGIR